MRVHQAEWHNIKNIKNFKYVNNINNYKSNKIGNLYNETWFGIPVSYLY